MLVDIRTSSCLSQLQVLQCSVAIMCCSLLLRLLVSDFAQLPKKKKKIKLVCSVYDVKSVTDFKSMLKNKTKTNKKNNNNNNKNPSKTIKPESKIHTPIPSTPPHAHLCTHTHTHTRKGKNTHTHMHTHTRRKKKGWVTQKLRCLHTTKQQQGILQATERLFSETGL